MSEVIYEVNLDIDAGIAAEYRSWLHAHVAQMLALPGFIDAQLHDVVDPAPAAGRIVICTRYRLRDAAALPAVDAWLQAQLPQVPRIVLHGHVCRRELAVEIDGSHA